MLYLQKAIRYPEIDNGAFAAVTDKGIQKYVK